MKNLPTSSTPFVNCPETRGFFCLLDELIEQRELVGTTPCMLVTAESGCGKSGLAEQYCRMNPHVNEEFRKHIPVIHVELKSVGTPKDLYMQILKEIGDPQIGNTYRNATELHTCLVTLANTIGLKLIIIDEVQTIIERRSHRVISGIADTFKDIIKGLKVPVVLMGLPWCKYLLDSNSQLGKRVEYRYELQPYKIRNAESFNNYRKFLKAIGDYYGCEPGFSLEQSDMAYRIFSYSSGFKRTIINLISSANFVSHKQKLKLNIEAFKTAVRKLGQSDSLNPFCIEMEELKFKELCINSDWLFTARSHKNSLVKEKYITLMIGAGELITVEDEVA